MAFAHNSSHKMNRMWLRDDKITPDETKRKRLKKIKTCWDRWTNGCSWEKTVCWSKNWLINWLMLL